MNRFATAALAAAVLLVSQSVSAQTPAPAQPPASGSNESMLDGLTYSVTGGATFTKKTGGLVGGEIVSPREYWKNTTFSIEGGWMSSVVNAHRIDSAAAIANYLAQTQGQPASATVKVPAGYGAVNVRYTVMIKPRYRVYVLGGGGIGVTSPKTKFTLGGSDVSGSLGQYGVTLGKDLAGNSAGGLVNVGVGATMPHGKWVGDASYRLTPIFSAGETTVVNRLNFGIGYKF
jgi:hypothetical protein